jgi:RNA polymerase sigma-70 factor (ECF subfamily)
MARAAATHADLELATLCVSGDEAAQREFFRRELRHVHATLYRVLGSNGDIDDLVQEAFLEIFRSLGGFRGDSSLSTWLDRIAVRVACTYLRHRRVPTTRLELVPEPRAGDATAEERVLAREAARRLYVVLDGLEPRKRIAFTLRVIDGRTFKEVAAVMESTVVLAKVRVWRAWQYVNRCARQDPVLEGFLQADRREKV